MSAAKVLEQKTHAVPGLSMRESCTLSIHWLITRARQAQDHGAFLRGSKRLL